MTRDELIAALESAQRASIELDLDIKRICQVPHNPAYLALRYTDSIDAALTLHDLNGRALLIEQDADGAYCSLSGPNGGCGWVEARAATMALAVAACMLKARAT